MELKELFLTSQVTENEDGSCLITQVDVGNLDPMLPFFIECKVYCRLLLDKDDPRELDVEAMLLGPKGLPGGFVTARDIDGTMTIAAWKGHHLVESGVTDVPLTLETQGLVFDEYGTYSLVLMVNGVMQSTIRFDLKNPQRTVTD